MIFLFCETISQMAVIQIKKKTLWQTRMECQFPVVNVKPVYFAWVLFSFVKNKRYLV